MDGYVCGGDSCGIGCVGCYLGVLVYGSFGLCVVDVGVDGGVGDDWWYYCMYWVVVVDGGYLFVGVDDDGVVGGVVLC